MLAPMKRRHTSTNRSQKPKSSAALRSQACQPSMTVVFPFRVMTYLCKMMLLRATTDA